MQFATRATKLRAHNSGPYVILRPLVILLPLLSAAFVMQAQQPQPDQQQTTTIKKDVNVVNVLATVRNKNGQIVTTLTQTDFKLDVEGRPQTIRYFSRVTDLPVLARSSG